jgi:hypothetical protein
MFHGDARTTVHGRLLIVKRHQAGMPRAHIAAAMGMLRAALHRRIRKRPGLSVRGMKQPRTHRCTEYAVGAHAKRRPFLLGWQEKRPPLDIWAVAGGPRRPGAERS